MGRTYFTSNYFDNMEIYLVRHTITVAGTGICYGQTDLDIQEPALPQFEAIKSNLPLQEADIYSSTLKRCSLLATHLANTKEVKKDPRLMELNFGDWENQKWSDMNTAEQKKWMGDFVNIPAPNGESFLQMYERITDFMDKELFKSNPDRKKIIVTHGGVIRLFLCYLLEMPLKNAFKIPIDFGSVTKINLDENRHYNRIEYMNKVFQWSY